MADTTVTSALPGPKPGGNLPDTLKFVEADDADGSIAALEATVPIRLCPNHPKNMETIKLQGDPHVRCSWCHEILD